MTIEIEKLSLFAIGIMVLLVGVIIGMLATDDNPGVFVDPLRRPKPRIPTKVLMWAAVALSALTTLIAMYGGG